MTTQVLPIASLIPLLLLVCLTACQALVPPPRQILRWRGNEGLAPRGRVAPRRPCTLQMRDASSANVFSVGDRVRVVDDVLKAGINLRGRLGTVVETWEKCDVDPTCCCAEFVDEGMAVHVKFTSDPDTDSLAKDGTFIHFFAENELLHVTKENAAPFDGLSCKAFKLEQLQMGEQAKRIAAFEASRSEGAGATS